MAYLVMFEPPNAKRVRRDQLSHSPSGSSPSSLDDGDAEILYQKLKALYATTSEDDNPQSLPAQAALQAPPTLPTHSQGNLGNEDRVDEGFAFRLFADSQPKKLRSSEIKTLQDETNDNVKASAARIRLDSPTRLRSSSPGFTAPRPAAADYYFAKATTPTLRARILVSAVSGEQVRRWSEQSWPGASRPWRVTLLKASRQEVKRLSQSEELSKDSAASRLLVPEGDDPNSRTRKPKPGKKRRIALRKRDRRCQKEPTKKDAIGNTPAKIKAKMKQKSGFSNGPIESTATASALQSTASSRPPTKGAEATEYPHSTTREEADKASVVQKGDSARSSAVASEAAIRAEEKRIRRNQGRKARRKAVKLEMRARAQYGEGA